MCSELLQYADLYSLAAPYGSKQLAGKVEHGTDELTIHYVVEVNDSNVVTRAAANSIPLAVSSSSQNIVTASSFQGIASRASAKLIRAKSSRY